VLSIEAGTQVMLQDLTITKGAAGMGAGIFNFGSLTLLGVGVTENTAVAAGAGIYNSRDLTLQTGSHVTGNTTTFEAGGGAGIFSQDGTATLQSGSTVTGNTSAYHAGGIYNHYGTLMLQSGSRVTGNTTSLDGGGIYSLSGTVTMKEGSRVTGNTAGGDGGGIYNNVSTVTLEGAAPSLIVVNNCQNNCAGDSTAKCAAGGTCPA
jgi:hypothetical protein